MIIEDFFYLLFIFLLVLVSGFFSGSETALTAVSKPRIYAKAKKGNKKANFVKKLIEKKEDLITTILLSNNLVNIFASALATTYLYKSFGNKGIIYSTLIMTAIIVIFGEVLPKTYALNRPTKTALSISHFLLILLKIFSPIIKIINFFINILLKNFTKKTIKTKDEQNEEELKGAIDLYKTSDPDSIKEKEMLKNILTLSDTSLDEIMTHRSNIYSINIDNTINEIIEKISKSNFTRIPIWKKVPENIIGVLDSRTINLKKYKKNSFSKNELKELIKKPWFVPESTDLLDQLLAFKKRKEHLVFIVDEYGELQGLVSLEDIIEEIVGDIIDEIDNPNIGIIENDDGSINSDGSIAIRDLNKLYGWELPEEDASTIAGLIINYLKRIPLYGEVIQYEKFEIKILSHSRKKIGKLNIKKTN